MKYKVDESFLEKVVKRFPMLRYNDSIFMNFDDYFYSEGGKFHQPFSQGKEVIHRVTSEISFKEDFEKDLNLYLKAADRFFNEDFTTFSNVKHFLLYGTKEDMPFTDLSNWNVVAALFENKMSTYLKGSRLTLNIPFGPVYATLAKVCDEYYFHIIGDKDFLETVKRDLELENYEETDLSWIEIIASKISK